MIPGEYDLIEEIGIDEKNEIKKKIQIIKGCRFLSKKDMILNGETPYLKKWIQKTRMFLL